MKSKIYLYLILCIAICACKKESSNENNEIIIKSSDSYYLSKYVGAYSGEKMYYRVVYPPTGQPAYGDTTYMDVTAQVYLGNEDSTLTIEFLNDKDSVFRTYDNIKFDSVPSHRESWGGGSSFGSRSITLWPDSFEYGMFSKCGRPCNSGESLLAKRL